MKQIDVCLCFDSNYATHAAATIASIVINSTAPVHIHIIHNGIADFIKNKLIKTIDNVNLFSKISFIKISNLDQFKFMPEWFYTKSKANYYRLLIPELFKDIDKIIYLDVDTIVTSDILELFNTKLNGNCIAGVLDMDHENYSKLLGTKQYINSGMIVFDLKKIRETSRDNLIDVSRNYIINNMLKTSNTDQDIINLAFADQIEVLGIEWNAQTVGTNRGYIFGGDNLEIPKKIVHFITNHKPWNVNCKSEYQYLYYKYLFHTPWRYKCYKYLYIKLLKFIFCKKNIKDNSKYIYLFGIPFMSRTKVTINNSKYRCYAFLGITIIKLKMKKEPL